VEGGQKVARGHRARRHGRSGVAMNGLHFGGRKLTETDFDRLSRLRGGIPADLEALLAHAQVVRDADMPAGIVTMYAQAVIDDTLAGRRKKVLPCYPEHAEPRAGYVSILSPVGIAVLGLELGSLACWISADGGRRSAEIVSVVMPAPGPRTRSHGPARSA
jgi:regulator of nucleoside diphosphate kinase